jgi:hypothetical protein
MRGCSGSPSRGLDAQGLRHGVWRVTAMLVASNAHVCGKPPDPDRSEVSRPVLDGRQYRVVFHTLTYKPISISFRSPDGDAAVGGFGRPRVWARPRRAPRVRQGEQNRPSDVFVSIVAFRLRPVPSPRPARVRGCGAAYRDHDRGLGPTRDGYFAAAVLPPDPTRPITCRALP